MVWRPSLYAALVLGVVSAITIVLTYRIVAIDAGRFGEFHSTGGAFDPIQLKVPIPASRSWTHRAWHQWAGATYMHGYNDRALGIQMLWIDGLIDLQHPQSHEVVTFGQQRNDFPVRPLHPLPRVKYGRSVTIGPYAVEHDRLFFDEPDFDLFYQRLGGTPITAHLTVVFSRRYLQIAGTIGLLTSGWLVYRSFRRSRRRGFEMGQMRQGA
jgi:hypothetical protein